MKGRYAVVMNTTSALSPTFTFWQRAFGSPYLFETRAEAHEVFRAQCKADGFKGPAGHFQYWVVELNEESAHIYPLVKAS